MAITFDAPSTDWNTETLTTPQPRVVFPIYQTGNAYIYELDYVVNPSGFTTTALNTSYVSTTLSSDLDSTETGTIYCTSTGTGTTDTTVDFPTSGRVKINNEFITYTGVNYSSNTLTGLSRGVSEGVVTSTAATHTAGDTVEFAAWLIEETSPVPQEGELIRWTRRYATVPNTWEDYEMRPYQFPGYYNDTTTSGYRPPKKDVSVWVVYHYYELARNGAYLDIAVPSQAFQPKDSNGVDIEFVDGSSSPTLTTYQGYVSAGNLISVSDSVMERYAGNIWVSKKFQAKAV